MEIRIGDIVRFLTDRLEGKVSGIIDTATVNVYVDEYGFEIPASVNDLVVIHTDFAGKREEGEGNVPADRQRRVETVSTDSLYLAVVPDNFNNLLESRYTLYLVNDTDQTCLYSICFRKGEKYTGIIAGNCSPDSSSSIGEYSLKDMDSQIKAVHVKAIFFQKGECHLKDAVESEIRINTVNLCKSGSYKHSRWFNSISLLRPLEKETGIHLEEMDVKQLKQAVLEKKKADTPVRTGGQTVEKAGDKALSNVLEIDLHCNEILETTAGMDNKDILEYQMDLFTKTMEEYKLRKGQKIVFIHGKGDGILRQRILWELQTRYRRHRHQDASFKQYGYGATLVTIK